MKRRISWFAGVLALTLSMNGCGPVPSFFPLYKTDDKAFEPGLVGIWKRAEPDPNNPDAKNERWIFARSEDEVSYDLKLGTVGANGGMLAKVRLVRMGSALFVDFEGDIENKAFESKDALMALPAKATHMMGRVWLEGDALQINFLKDDWVQERIKAGAFPLSHLGENEDLILTATTDELRRFMKEHAEDKEALSENIKLMRAR